MTGNVDERRQLLGALIDLAAPLPEVCKRLARFAWDAEEDLVSLEPHHVSLLLRRFLEGEVPATTIEAWAEAVEGREDIGFGDPIVGEIVFALANPDLEGRLTPERARMLLNTLPKG